MDIGHEVGNDLSIDASGGLVIVAGDTWTRQRVLRRLLTNAGDYIWDLPYGGGLRRMIGTPVVTAQIEAIIRTQMKLEASVANDPAPVVTVTEAGIGVVSAEVTYTDATTLRTSALGVTIGGQP